MAKLTLDDLDLRGKRVLTRVDFNVPLDGDRITDDTRIRGALPTIRKITGDGGIAVLMSHLGRPKGSPDERYSLRPVADYLRGLLDVPVAFCEDTAGDRAREVVAEAPAGSVVLLENTRFEAGETRNDGDLSARLAELGDVYVNDAFGAAHRAHASTVGVTDHLQPAAMGYLLQREVETLDGLLTNPGRPFLAVLGGAKVSDKLGVIKALLEKVDGLLIGGAMAYTFLKGTGTDVGGSRIEEDLLDEARQLHEGAPDVIQSPPGPRGGRGIRQ
jgi:phosphoglycerate kinase